MPGLDVPAERIDSPFPIVALVGVLRPRLFVAATVLDSCTRQELQTVIAHEMAHARTLDNLRRLLLIAVPDPLAWLLTLERQRLVRQGLARLAPRDAEILLLKYTEDWSYRELADRLGVSTSAVEARLHRARQRLRDELAALESSAMVGAEKGMR